ncbi:hypothetical protein PR048_031113 [Dryococelus australis]|uniref:Uncharacterized protein n=1 Tax=Dryococelus australis TaxID=614101 RepID=A0ABQ9G793_9NEOP|nr:hypothetical protein PR048_031113 [Dryococelus australis]
MVQQFSVSILDPISDRVSNHDGETGHKTRLLASHIGGPGSIPGGVARRFSACGNRAGRCLWSAGFSRGFPFPPPLHSDAVPFLTPLHPHRLSRPLHPMRREHCTPVQSLALSGDGAPDARGIVVLIVYVLLGLGRRTNLLLGGDLKEATNLFPHIGSPGAGREMHLDEVRECSCRGSEAAGLYLNEPGSNPVGGTPGFLHVYESCWTMPMVGGFSPGPPVSPRSFISALLYTYLASPLSALKTSTPLTTKPKLQGFKYHNFPERDPHQNLRASHATERLAPRSGRLVNQHSAGRQYVRPRAGCHACFLCDIIVVRVTYTLHVSPASFDHQDAAHRYQSFYFDVYFAWGKYDLAVSITGNNRNSTDVVESSFTGVEPRNSSHAHHGQHISGWRSANSSSEGRNSGGGCRIGTSPESAASITPLAELALRTPDIASSLARSRKPRSAFYNATHTDTDQVIKLGNSQLSRVRESVQPKGFKLNSSVLFILEPPSFLHWLLTKRDATPLLTELHVIQAHNWEVFIYWRRTTQGVSSQVWSNGKPTAKVHWCSQLVRHRVWDAGGSGFESQLIN